MKECTKCNIKKNLEDFSKKKTAKDGRHSQCRVCTRKSTREHYKNNKQYYKDKSKSYRKKMTQWFVDFKSTLSCNRCGENRWWVLDFHHKNPQNKEYSLSGLASNVSKETFFKEVEKCEVLCSNCHRDHHHKENL